MKMEIIQRITESKISQVTLYDTQQNNLLLFNINKDIDGMKFIFPTDPFDGQIVSFFILDNIANTTYQLPEGVDIINYPSAMAEGYVADFTYVRSKNKWYKTK